VIAVWSCAPRSVGAAVGPHADLCLWLISRRRIGAELCNTIASPPDRVRRGRRDRVGSAFVLSRSSSQLDRFRPVLTNSGSGAYVDALAIPPVPAGMSVLADLPIAVSVRAGIVRRSSLSLSRDPLAESIDHAETSHDV
jgi:hypothetical protein